MTRRIEGRAGIEVYPTERGQIAIKQDGDMVVEESLVIIDPNDVPTLVQWLQDVAEDARELRREWLDKQDTEPIEVGE